MRILPVAHLSRQRRNAFTMIEIALALAVIGFALVAVIGILPTGLTAQKENREETIVNQDGPYFIELIRNGSQGLDHLTEYVDQVGIVTLIDPDPDDPKFATNFNYYTDLPLAGSNVVGLISIPFETDFNGFPVHRVVMKMRALSGSAVEAGSGASKDFGFSYELTTEVVRFNVERDAMGPMIDPILDQSPYYYKSLQGHLYEIRVTCRWPLLPSGKVGPNRKTFRALATGKFNDAHAPLYFFVPHTFQRPTS